MKTGTSLVFDSWAILCWVRGEAPASQVRVLLEMAAGLKSRSRLSYADAFAANLAIDLGATLVTGDPELALMTDKFDVEWLGRPPAA